MIGAKNIKREFKEDGTAIDITVTCPICTKEQPTFTVNARDHDAWLHGSLIQDAFPYLTAEERELLVSGTCDPCWSDIVDGL